MYDDRKTSGLAIGTAVCGLLSFCGGLTGIAAIMMGPAAILTINKSDGRQKGMGLTIFGMIAGALGIACWVVGYMTIQPMFAQWEVRDRIMQDSDQLAGFQYSLGGNQWNMNEIGLLPDTAAEFVVAHDAWGMGSYMSPWEDMDSGGGRSGLTLSPSSGGTTEDNVEQYQGYWFVHKGIDHSKVKPMDRFTIVVAFSRYVSDRQPVRHVLFLDGHVQEVPIGQLRPILEADNKLREDLDLPTYSLDAIDDLPPADVTQE